MRSMEEIITILHFEKDHIKINALEEMEIMKATTSDHMLNIMQNINPLYQILVQSLQDQTGPAQIISEDARVSAKGLVVV